MAEKQFNPSYVKSRRSLLKHVEGSNLKVLDVGCATGENGRFLLQEKIASSVYGFEIDGNMASVAEKDYDNVFIGDLELFDLDKILEQEFFDFIIIGDVLEHLKEPWAVLKKLSSTLKPEGKIILSLPNIQHIDMFIHVYLKGVWPYNERGIFDKTHLRFFTLKNMNELISQAGLITEKMERKYRRRDKSKFKFKHSPLEAVLKYFFKNLYTFQYVFVCRRADV